MTHDEITQALAKLLVVVIITVFFGVLVEWVAHG